MHKWLKLILLAFGFLLSTQLFADVSGSLKVHNSAHKLAINRVLQIGVIDSPPFVMRTSGGYNGILIDVWDSIAKQNNFQYVLIPQGADVDTALKKVNEGELDLVLGTTPVSYERLKFVDFSRPFFLNRIGVVIAKTTIHPFLILKTFFSSTLLIIFLALITTFLIYIHLLWHFERGKISDMPVDYKSAIKHEMWLYLFRKGLSNIPTTIFGRLTALFWLFVGAALLSSFNAALTANLTLASSQGYESVTNINDLRAERSATVKGTTATMLVEHLGVRPTVVPTLGDAISMLENGRIAAVVYNTIPAKYYIKENHLDKKMMLSTYVVQTDELAIPVRIDSPLRRQINFGLLKLEESSMLSMICQKYLGTNDSKDCQL